VIFRCQHHPRTPVLFIYPNRLNRLRLLKPNQNTPFAAAFFGPVLLTADDSVVIGTFNPLYPLGCKILKIHYLPCPACRAHRPRTYLEKNLSPVAIFPSGAHLVFIKRDSMVFRPVKITSKYSFFSIAKCEFAIDTRYKWHGSSQPLEAHKDTLNPTNINKNRFLSDHSPR
jgi:hypothetical protein